MISAEDLHKTVMRLNPLYLETSHWYPVVVSRENSEAAYEWIMSIAPRGNTRMRNEWLFPVDMFFLIRDQQLALEFKLRWT